MNATTMKTLKTWKMFEMKIKLRLMMNRTEHAKEWVKGRADDQVGNRNIITNYTLSFLHRFITSQAAVRRKAYWNVLCCKLTQEPFIKRKIVARRNAASEECKDWDWLQPCGIIIQSVFKQNRLAICDVQHVVALSYWISGSERERLTSPERSEIIGTCSHHRCDVNGNTWSYY